MKRKAYFINTYRKEESEKVLNTLTKYEVYDVHKKSGIMCFETINFDCNKKVWKQIKKELNLIVKSVFSEIKVES